MKKDYIIKLMDENYDVRRINISNNEKYVKKCYHLGFLDGYMREELFKDMITKEIGNISYERGYRRGLGLRDNSSSKELNKKKEYFIARYAFYDGINGIENSSAFSDKFKSTYDSYVHGGYSFKTGKFIKK